MEDYKLYRATIKSGPQCIPIFGDILFYFDTPFGIMVYDNAYGGKWEFTEWEYIEEVKDWVTNLHSGKWELINELIFLILTGKTPPSIDEGKQLKEKYKKKHPWVITGSSSSQGLTYYES